MSSTTPSARLLTKAPAARDTRMSKRPAVDAAFAASWNALDRDDRRQIRRLVRIGRPKETRGDAELALGFAAYQRSRPWYRLFWLWIVPLTLAGVVAGMNTHPIVIGLVLGAAASAVMVRRNFRRAESINAPLLDAPG
jgi:hypothetical protein